MSEMKEKRAIRVHVGRHVRAIGLLVLAVVLLLICLGLSNHWITDLTALVGLAAVGVAMGYRLVHIHRHGLEIFIETEATPQSAEEPPAEETSLPQEPEDHVVEPDIKEPHWTEVAYPDPDEELFGRQQSAEEIPNDSVDVDPTHWSEKAYPDPDNKAQA